MLDRTRTLVAAVAVGGALLALGTTPVVGAQPLTRFVDGDGHAGGAGGCSGQAAAPTSIQQAIETSGPADTVLVCPGTYAERITIAGPERDGLVLRAAQPGTVTIRPPAGAATGGGDVLLTVRDTDRVRVIGLRLRAPTDGPCHRVESMVRVAWHSHDATIQDLDVRPAGTDTFGPCGFSDGIVVLGAGARVIGSAVTDFQRDGIVVWPSVEAEVLGNRVAFRHAGATFDPDVVGSAGIAFFGHGLLRGNAVVGLSTAAATTPMLLDGISVVYDDHSAIRTRIEDNLVVDAWRGITCCNLREHVSIARNTVLGSKDRGLTVVQVTDALVEHNLVTGSGSFGLLVRDHARGIMVRDNDLRGNTGRDCVDRTHGDGTAGTANTWIRNLGADDRPTSICAPVPSQPSLQDRAPMRRWGLRG